MNFLNVFNNKSIRIPLLQRDYIQGSNESVISPFIDSLIDESNTSDLNYIYGYTDDQNYFIPIDGQQRLTTLWILYLYAAAKADNQAEFNVNLTFLSREYANDFCRKIKCNISEVLQGATATDNLSDKIQDKSWFLSSWINNSTVKNMLLTLKYIHRKCAGLESETLWNYLKSDNSITFAFLDMSGDNGLDDDIYIKMNGRGRPLSIFENLKSWMDEKVKLANETWKDIWIENMDNLWTQFFWNNRNLNQDHPEEIDDEQLFCFCNLIILYWMLNNEQLLNHIHNIRESDHYLYEQLLSLFPQSKETDGSSEIAGYLFDDLQRGNLPSLVWIERLNLLPTAFFDFAYKSLNQLASTCNTINSMGLFLGNASSVTTPIYDLALSEGSYGRTLPLLYAVLLCSEDDPYAWMRVCRNLILNTDIGKENLSEILTGLNQFSEHTKQERVYTVLQRYEKSNDNFLHSFKGAQVKEECKKATMPSEYFPQMEKMENTRFFSGCINSVFRTLEHEDGLTNYTSEDFIDCSNILMEIFTAENGQEGGVRNIYDRHEDRLLRRALMTCPPYFYGIDRNGCWCFCNNMEEWRSFLNNNDTKFDALRLLIIKSCLPALKKSYDISESVQQCLQRTIDNANLKYEEKLEANDDTGKFNLHFIHHPGIWNYMETSRCYWDESEFYIILKYSNSNNSKKMELRTYALYLDYLDTSKRYDLIEDREDWRLDIWQKDKTCMYFESEIPQTNRKVAIDVFHKCTRENDYTLNIFLRPTDEEENNHVSYIENNRAFFEAFSDIALCVPGIYQDKESGRYITDNTFSRKEIILILRNLLPSLKKYIGIG